MSEHTSFPSEAELIAAAALNPVEHRSSGKAYRRDVLGLWRRVPEFDLPRPVPEGDAAPGPEQGAEPAGESLVADDGSAGDGPASDLPANDLPANDLPVSDCSGDGASSDHARHLSHPAGRGWIPAGRDVGLPGEAVGDAEWRFAAGVGGGSSASSPSSSPPFVMPAQAGIQSGEVPGALDPRLRGDGEVRGTEERCFDKLSTNGSGVAPAPALAFTPARRALFCDLLAASGNVRAVCARVGVSPHTAYRQRRRDAGFSALWDAALVLARDHAEAVLAERALEGVEEAVFYHGEEVARRRRFDTRLLLAHIGRLDARYSARAEANAARFDGLLAQLGAGAGALPDRARWVEDRAEAASLAAMREEYAGSAREDEEAEHEGRAGDPLAGEALDGADWEDAYEEEGEDWSDPVRLAEEQARAEAGAEWDGLHAAACAWVDTLADRIEEAEDVDTVPLDLPYEVKGIAGRDVEAVSGDPECSSAVPVVPVTPTPTTPTTTTVHPELVEGCALPVPLRVSRPELPSPRLLRQAQDERSLVCEEGERGKATPFTPRTVSPPVSLPRGPAALSVESLRCGGRATGLPSA